MDIKQWLRKNPDRVAAWVAVALGALALFLGWQGASTTEYPAEQLPYILSGGIGGALLVAFGASLLVSADLRDEWYKLDRIERRLAGTDPDASLPAVALDDEVDPATDHAAASETDVTVPEASDADGANGQGRRRVLTARQP